MPSPFPGMDPYLEGYLWPDFHHEFTIRLRAMLNLLLPSGYVGRLAVLTIQDEVERAKVITVEVYETTKKELITAIEMLSPINKREPHLGKYRQKRARLIQAGIHLIEIDLVRRGQRPCHYPEIPDTPYLVTSTTAAAPAVTLWPLTLQQKLPTIPVPMRSPDPDVPLDLAQVFDTAYEYAAYDLSIDYDDEPPPPKLPPADLEWWQQHRQSFT